MGKCLSTLKHHDRLDSKKHTFKTKFFKHPNSCQVCSDVIWNEGRTCKVCKFTCHRKCEYKVSTACEPSSDYAESRNVNNNRPQQTQQDTISATVDYNKNKMMSHSHPEIARQTSRGEAHLKYSFDLDVDYITERLIAVSFPAGGLEAQYCSNLHDVVGMLKNKHQDKYVIFNLSQRRHDIAQLSPQVYDLGWPDHLAPSLEKLCSICKHIETWLKQDPHHVVVLHCKGGRGPIGVIVLAYMNYINITSNSETAMDRYAMKRFLEAKTESAMQPSQHRYVNYFTGLLTKSIHVNSAPLFLHHVLIHGVPNYDVHGGCRPFLRVYQGMQPIFTSGVYSVPEGTSQFAITLDQALPVRGDILVKCYHKRFHATSRDVIFRCQFHTTAIVECRLVFQKADLDDAITDARFPDFTKVEFVFSHTPDQLHGSDYVAGSNFPVDDTDDPLIRWDSYENFDKIIEGGDYSPEVIALSANINNNIPHSSAPDGSLYAEVQKTPSPIQHDKRFFGSPTQAAPISPISNQLTPQMASVGDYEMAPRSSMQTTQMAVLRAKRNAQMDPGYQTSKPRTPSPRTPTSDPPSPMQPHAPAIQLSNGPQRPTELLNGPMSSGESSSTKRRAMNYKEQRDLDDLLRGIGDEVPVMNSPDSVGSGQEVADERKIVEVQAQMSQLPRVDHGHPSMPRSYPSQPPSMKRDPENPYAEIPDAAPKQNLSSHDPSNQHSHPTVEEVISSSRVENVEALRIPDLDERRTPQLHDNPTYAATKNEQNLQFSAAPDRTLDAVDSGDSKLMGQQINATHQPSSRQVDTWQPQPLRAKKEQLVFIYKEDPTSPRGTPSAPMGTQSAPRQPELVEHPTRQPESRTSAEIGDDAMTWLQRQQQKLKEKREREGGAAPRTFQTPKREHPRERDRTQHVPSLPSNDQVQNATMQQQMPISREEPPADHLSWLKQKQKKLELKIGQAEPSTTPLYIDTSNQDPSFNLPVSSARLDNAGFNSNIVARGSPPRQLHMADLEKSVKQLPDVHSSHTSAAPGPLTPPHTYEHEADPARMELWQTHQRPLNRQMSDITYDREKPITRRHQDAVLAPQIPSFGMGDGVTSLPPAGPSVSSTHKESAGVSHHYSTSPYVPVDCQTLGQTPRTSHPHVACLAESTLGLACDSGYASSLSSTITRASDERILPTYVTKIQELDGSLSTPRPTQKKSLKSSFDQFSSQSLPKCFQNRAPSQDSSLPQVAPTDTLKTSCDPRFIPSTISSSDSLQYHVRNHNPTVLQSYNKWPPDPDSVHNSRSLRSKPGIDTTSQSVKQSRHVHSLPRNQRHIYGPFSDSRPNTRSEHSFVHDLGPEVECVRPVTPHEPNDTKIPRANPTPLIDNTLPVPSYRWVMKHIQALRLNRLNQESRNMHVNTAGVLMEHSTRGGKRYPNKGLTDHRREHDHSVGRYGCRSEEEGRHQNHNVWLKRRDVDDSQKERQAMSTEGVRAYSPLDHHSYLKRTDQDQHCAGQAVGSNYSGIVPVHPLHTNQSLNVTNANHPGGATFGETQGMPADPTNPHSTINLMDGLEDAIRMLSEWTHFPNKEPSTTTHNPHISHITGPQRQTNLSNAWVGTGVKYPSNTQPRHQVPAQTAKDVKNDAHDNVDLHIDESNIEEPLNLEGRVADRIADLTFKMSGGDQPKSPPPTGPRVRPAKAKPVITRRTPQQSGYDSDTAIQQYYDSPSPRIHEGSPERWLQNPGGLPGQESEYWNRMEGLKTPNLKEQWARKPEYDVASSNESLHNGSVTPRFPVGPKAYKNMVSTPIAVVGRPPHAPDAPYPLSPIRRDDRDVLDTTGLHISPSQQVAMHTAHSLNVDAPASTSAHVRSPTTPEVITVTHRRIVQIERFVDQNGLEEAPTGPTGNFREAVPQQQQQQQQQPQREQPRQQHLQQQQLQPPQQQSQQQPAQQQPQQQHMQPQREQPQLQQPQQQHMQPQREQPQQQQSQQQQLQQQQRQPQQQLPQQQQQPQQQPIIAKVERVATPTGPVEVNAEKAAVHNGRHYPVEARVERVAVTKYSVQDKSDAPTKPIGQQYPAHGFTLSKKEVTFQDARGGVPERPTSPQALAGTRDHQVHIEEEKIVPTVKKPVEVAPTWPIELEVHIKNEGMGPAIGDVQVKGTASPSISPQQLSPGAQSSTPYRQEPAIVVERIQEDHVEPVLSPPMMNLSSQQPPPPQYPTYSDRMKIRPPGPLYPTFSDRHRKAATGRLEEVPPQVANGYHTMYDNRGAGKAKRASTGSEGMWPVHAAHHRKASDSSVGPTLSGRTTPSNFYLMQHPSPYSSSVSLADTSMDKVRFVKDLSAWWYKPHISRDEAITMLKDKCPGQFVVRDSNSFPGAFGLAVKVAQLPPNTPPSKKVTDPASELVRHFLIEPNPRGVRLKGCANEPIFGSLSALIYQHTLTQLALPCKLQLPESDPSGPDATDSAIDPKSAHALLSQGAACNVLYLTTMEMESLTGTSAVREATSRLLKLKDKPKRVVVHFKVSLKGITLTDNHRKLFFRRHYPVESVLYCGTDTGSRKWKKKDGSDESQAKIFGFVSRKPGSKTDNQCHLFAEYEIEQPASAIVSFVTKVLMGSAVHS